MMLCVWILWCYDFYKANICPIRVCATTKILVHICHHLHPLPIYSLVEIISRPCTHRVTRVKLSRAMCFAEPNFAGGVVVRAGSVPEWLSPNGCAQDAIRRRRLAHPCKCEWNHNTTSINTSNEYAAPLATVDTTLSVLFMCQFVRVPQ